MMQIHQYLQVSYRRVFYHNKKLICMVSFAEMLVEHLTTQLAQNTVQDRQEPTWFCSNTKSTQKTRCLQIPVEDLLISPQKAIIRQPHPLLLTTVLWITCGFPGVFYRQNYAKKIQVFGITSLFKSLLTEEAFHTREVRLWRHELNCERQG